MVLVTMYTQLKFQSTTALFRTQPLPSSRDTAMKTPKISHFTISTLTVSRILFFYDIAWLLHKKCPRDKKIFSEMKNYIYCVLISSPQSQFHKKWKFSKHVKISGMAEMNCENW